MKTTITLWVAGLMICALNAQTTVSTFSDGSPDDAIAFDSNGNIYASGFVSNTVYKFTPAGTMTEFIPSGLQNPNGIDFDSSDFLWMSEWGANRIGKYDTNGMLDQEFTIPGNPSGMIKAFDNDDMIYTRYTGNTINRITSSGTITEISSAPELNGPVGLAYDEFGVLYVGNYNNREIYRVLPNGDLEYIATVGGSSNLGFITYAQGMLWGTVLAEHKIYAINPNATDDVILFAGSTLGNDDGDINVATFNRPNGIKFNDAEDTMYVTDFGSKNLRVISNVILNTTEKELSNGSMKIYPNPAMDNFNIRFNLPDLSPGELEIYDTLGRSVFTSKINPTSLNFNLSIDCSSWQKGVYLVSFTSERGTQTSRLLR